MSAELLVNQHLFGLAHAAQLHSGHSSFCPSQVLKARMAAVQAADDAKRASAHAKNDLESYIIATRGGLNVR